ncbi:MAG: HAD family phosphatase [Lachnospiraceae bacterium]
MLTDIKGVIFDLDGTLVDSMWLWPAVDEEYMNKYALTMPERFHEKIEGMSFTETARYFLEEFPDLHQSIEQVQTEWLDMTLEKYTTQVTLKPGALEFITELKKRGIKFGIATSNTRKLVDATLKALGVDAFFDSVRTACEVSAGKPAPDVYLKVAQDLHTAPKNCLVFEDVPMGILAGKNAGMTVCGVDDDFSRNQEKRKKELADYYIKDYYDFQNKTYEVL